MDHEGIKERNNHFASNPGQYAITRRIRLHPNVLAKPTTLADIVGGIKGCTGVIVIVMNGWNTLTLNAIQQYNVYSALSRKKMELQIIEGFGNCVDPMPNSGTHAEINATRAHQYFVTPTKNLGL